jgi:anion-transporting  ArsA/GET3 family ATPase
MTGTPLDAPLLVVVGAGGVGKTTLAAALGVVSARDGAGTLVMTFDPSRRLKDALGVGNEATVRPVPVPLTGARLDASLLDARRTFDALVRRYAPDPAAARRILENRFYRHLAGNLAGVLEYMAVERLFEVARDGEYDRVILDTPPTRQALDFLEAPDRIVGFLDSGALRVALKPWFAPDGALRRGRVRRRVAGLLDRVVGLELLREMAEFFQAFAPLYDGFRRRSREVQALLRKPDTRFLLVAGPGESRVADTLFFARRLRQAGHHLAGVVVNQVNPGKAIEGDQRRSEAIRGDPGAELLEWLGERDARGLVALRQLVTDGTPVADLPLLPEPPTGLPALEALGRLVRERFGGASRPAPRRPWRRKARA